MDSSTRITLDFTVKEGTAVALKNALSAITTEFGGIDWHRAKAQQMVTFHPAQKYDP